RLVRIARLVSEEDGAVSPGLEDLHLCDAVTGDMIAVSIVKLKVADRAGRILFFLRFAKRIQVYLVHSWPSRWKVAGVVPSRTDGRAHNSAVSKRFGRGAPPRRASHPD